MSEEKGSNREGPLSQEQLVRLRRIKARHEAELMQKANVVGVGIGLRKEAGRLTDEPAIIVSVTHKVPLAALSPEDLVPQELEGIPVDVDVVGHVHAQTLRQG